MDYNLNIVASVKGQAQLDSTLRTIGQIRNLVKDLKPLDFGTGRKGALADEIRKAKRELDDFARGVTNAMQKGEKTTGLFSSTLAGVTSQARAFGTALDNINFNKNAAEAKNYANALAQAEAKAEGLTAVQNKLITQARREAGVAIGPATQLGSPEAVAQQVRFESAQITKANRLRGEQVKLVERINALASKDVQVGRLNSQVARINLALDEQRVDAAEEMSEELRNQIRQNEKIINQNKTKKKGAEDEEKAAKKTRRTRKQMLGDAAQGAILGGGFPLLFGGPSFSAVGGLLGGGVAGGLGGQKASFAGGILGSVLGTPFDAITKSALELGKALESPTKNIQQLVDVLPLAGSKTKGLIGDLKELGLDSVAGALAVQELNDQLGALGLQDVEKLKEGTDALSNAFKELKLLGVAFAAPGLVNGIKLLTSLIVGIKQDQGFLARATRATLSFLTRSDATEDFQNRTGAFANTPAATLNRLKQENQEKNKGTQLTERQLQVQALVNDIRSQRVGIAQMEAQIEEHKFSFIRGDLEVVQAALQVDQAQLELDKARLNVLAEENESEKARLIVKRDIAQAALDEAKASKQNAEILARQQQASAELGIRQFLQGIQLNEMQQRIGTDRQVRSTSPFARESFLMDPFFGKSSELQNEQALRYTETLQILNAQIAENNLNIEKGGDLTRAELDALVRKGVILERELKLHQELTPARNEAALAQVRFAEAMAITVPVTDSLFDSLIGVVEGTKTAEQAFADFLRSIGSMLVDAAKQMIATYIAIGIARMFAGMPKMSGGETIDITAVDPNTINSLGGLNFGGYRADGGRTTPGNAYMVGERGPELFVPGAQGNIVPNNAMGGANVTVNVDASGSSVEGNADQASQLGKAIGIAVQQELVKQKRPGGLLAS